MKSLFSGSIIVSEWIVADRGEISFAKNAAKGITKCKEVRRSGDSGDVYKRCNACVPHLFDEFATETEKTGQLVNGQRGELRRLLLINPGGNAARNTNG